MYLHQAWARSKEKEKAAVEALASHQALTKKHTELQQVSEKLRIASMTDSLTGANNRRYFMENIEKMVHSAVRHHHSLAIVMLDIDHFKSINDTYGHPVGDAILKGLSELCRATLRTEDLFANCAIENNSEDAVFSRFGGEEFVMALPHTDVKKARVLAERLRSAIEQEVLDKDNPGLKVTVSIGISELVFSEEVISGAIKRADSALYTAKNTGRNRIVIAEGV